MGGCNELHLKNINMVFISTRLDNVEGLYHTSRHLVYVTFYGHYYKHFGSIELSSPHTVYIHHGKVIEPESTGSGKLN